MKVLTVELALIVFGLIILTQIIIPAITGDSYFWLFKKTKLDSSPQTVIKTVEKLKKETEEVVEDFHEKKQQAEAVSKQLEEIKEKFNNK